MFEREEYQFDPETDGFYSSTLSSSPSQTVGPQRLNEAVLEAFAAVQQAQVVLADAVTDWDAADAWSVDGALNASSWLRGKLGISNPSAHTMLTFARKTSVLAPSVRDAVANGVLSTDKANQLLHCFTKKRIEYVERDVDVLIGAAAGMTVNQARLMMV
jgi:hypothetical protein